MTAAGTTAQAQTRKIIYVAILALSLLALSIAATGCQAGTGTKDAQQSNPDALSLWVKDSDYRSYVKEAISLYEGRTGNDVSVTSIPDESFATTVESAFQKGEGPDILMHYNNSELAKMGIEDDFLVLNDQAWVDSIMPGARTYCDDGHGNLVGLPFWESSISGCYYNKTILSSLGLKPASTQAEFDMLCQALDSIDYTPMFWGEDCGWMYQFGLDPVFADDPDLLHRLNDGEIDFADIPQIHDMVQWVYDAYRSGWLGDPKGKGLDDVSASLASGESVMVDIWDTWFETDFQAGRYSADDFALMPVFMGTSNDGSYEGGNLNMMVVNKNARHLDEAIGFLEFCADPDVYNEAFQGVPSAKVFDGQTTIVTSDMVVEASDSIAKLERASTAAPKVSGYSQEDMILAFKALLNGEVDVDGCIEMMDDMRKSKSA